MERTQNAMKLCDLEKTRKYEKTREIKRFFKRSFPNEKTISSQPRYDHFDTLPDAVTVSNHVRYIIPHPMWFCNTFSKNYGIFLPFTGSDSPSLPRNPSRSSG